MAEEVYKPKEVERYFWHENDFPAGKTFKDLETEVKNIFQKLGFEIYHADKINGIVMEQYKYAEKKGTNFNDEGQMSVGIPGILEIIYRQDGKVLISDETFYDENENKQKKEVVFTLRVVDSTDVSKCSIPATMIKIQLSSDLTNIFGGRLTPY